MVTETAGAQKDKCVDAYASAQVPCHAAASRLLFTHLLLPVCPLQIRTNSEAALQYNDRSINENMHLAAAFRLLARPECNFLSQ